jgi:DNA mismatch repair protein MSH3
LVYPSLQSWPPIVTKSCASVARSEASAIVSGATPSSLVILDELGRGTSTRDGAAIAEATLRHLAERVRPLTLFITQ